MIMEETRRRSYTIIEPRFTWSQSEDCETLTVDASGFKEEQLRVSANTRRKLKISGERHLDGNRWVRFVEEFRIPKSCHIKGIRAEFNKEDQMLHIILPKSTRRAKSQNQPTQVSKPPMDRKTSEKTDSIDSQARKATDEKNLEGSSEVALQRAEGSSIKGEQETLPIKNEGDSEKREEQLTKENERDSRKRDEEFTEENERDERFTKENENERDSRKRDEEFTKENERDSRKRDEELTKENETSQEANEPPKKPRKRWCGLLRWFKKIKAFVLYVVVPILIIVGVKSYLM